MDSNLDSMLIESELIVPVSIEFHNDLSREDFELLCRLCGNSSPQLMPIYSNDGNEHNLPDKIREHLPIIQVSKTDVLPLSICYQCASTLISWHELYYACKDADLRLKEIYSRFKFEKIEPEENLMEIHDDVEYDDPVDSHEPVEFPTKPQTPFKPEVIIPSAISDEKAFVGSNLPRAKEPLVCSKSTISPSAVDSEVKTTPTAETRNRCSTGSSAKQTKWIKGLCLVRVEKPYKPLSKKCVVCLGNVDISATNDVLCAACLLKEPRLLQLPLSETPSPSTSLRKYIWGTAETGLQLKCDKCDFMCDPLSQVFNAHHSAHSVKPRPKEAPGCLTEESQPPPEPFQCDKCQKQFVSKVGLIRHLRKHEKKVYSCPSCVSTFKTLAQLRTHKKRHVRISLNRTFIFCEVCKKYFKSKKGFAYHQENICVRFKCYICNITFPDASSMAVHSDLNHNRESKTPHGHQMIQVVELPVPDREELPAKVDLVGPLQDIADTDAPRKEMSTKSQCSVCGKVVTTAVLPRHMILHTKEEPFTCDMCGKSFKRKSSLQDHIMIEMGMKNYVCDICGMKFLKQGYLNKHMKYHKLSNGEIQGFACEMCGKRFSEKWRLGVHQRAVHKGGRFSSCKCDICGKLFAERYMVRVHKHQEHNGEEFHEFKCNMCDRRFLEQWLLKSHQRNTHRDGTRKVYCDLCGRSDHQQQDCAHRQTLQKVPCVLCGETFSSNITLREHVVTTHVATEHDSAVVIQEMAAEVEKGSAKAAIADSKKNVFYVCAGCGKHFVNKLHLRSHELQNKCYKPERHDCNLCERSFSSLSSLSNHLMLHKKESAHLPFRCEFCSKDFGTEESLQLHLSLEKVCLLCDGVYPCNDLLKNHVFGEHNDEDEDYPMLVLADDPKSEAGDGVTDGAKLFQCKLCGKKFLRKQAMKNHLFAEMNLRRYVCEFCDKSYNYYSHLKEHLVSNHGEKEFLCGYCGKDFPTKKRFRDHVSLHSEEKPFVCQCGQSFKLPRYLSKHKKNCKLTNFSSIKRETVEILEVK